MLRHRLPALLLVLLCGCVDNPGANGLPGIDVPDAGGILDAEHAETGRDDGGASARERELILGVPETESIAIEALREPVHVVRTEVDIPHVYATNEHDLYVAMGWVLASDRYFEYEVAWRFALGELSEVLGRFGIASDVQARGQGMRIVAERILAGLDDETGERFDAFAEGINAYVDAVAADEAPAPSEYVLAAPLLGGTPAELMSRADRRTLAAFAAFVVFQSSFTQNDLLRTVIRDDLEDHFSGAAHAELRQGGIEDLFDDTTPRHRIPASEGFGLNGSASIPSSLFSPGRRSTEPARLAPLARPLRERARQRGETWTTWVGTREASDRGSNAWAVGQDQTANGSVLLAGDGHLSLGIPTLFFQMGADLRAFGDDRLRVMGLYLPGFPFLAVGTNGDVAWSQTYPRADVMDWYREELRLDPDGLPDDSLHDGEWRSLERIDEEYHLAGVLTDDPADVVYPRWEIFDGRLLVDVEGRTVDDPDTVQLGDGEALVNMGGTWVVPSDVDGDGKVTGVSVDYTGFDIGRLAGAVEAMQRAESVEQFQENARAFVGYAQNLIVADRGGTVGFTPFTAMPCRNYLRRAPTGEWEEGADPTLLLDGTRYGGFQVKLGPDGAPDPNFYDGASEGGAEINPHNCIVPWEAYPRTVKESGWVVNANNDPHGGSFDGTLTDDLYYIGGPWVPGYRANAIVERLESVSGSADVEAMAEIQAHHGSQLGVDFAPEVIAAVERAKSLQGTPDDDLDAAGIRLRDIYSDADGPRLDEATTRLQEWLDRGANAASGVETFYDEPTDEDRADAVATMIFNAWLRQWIAAVFADEQIDGLLSQPGRARGSMIRALRTLTAGKGDDNPMNLASWNPETAESIYFDHLATGQIVETSDEMAVVALRSALEFLESEPRTGLNGGFGTTDMDAWLWGLRHRVVLDSILAAFAGGNPAVNVITKEFAIDTDILPLARDIPEGDPREHLRWFPRPGDYFGVDASNPSFSGDNFDYADGPVMRMVIEITPEGTVRGQNIIPGGQSGLNDSPHFADQAALWLGNDTVPLRWSPEDVAEGAVGREVLAP